jgi:uncharacterized integral membrane protein
MAPDSRIFAALVKMYMILSGVVSELRSYGNLAWLEFKAFVLEKRYEQHGIKADHRAILQEARMIGGALIMLLIITLVLTEVYAAINIDNNSTWYPIVESLETTGVSAVVLLVVGLLVISATAIMRFFGGGGFGGR